MNNYKFHYSLHTLRSGHFHLHSRKSTDIHQPSLQQLNEHFQIHSRSLQLRCNVHRHRTGLPTRRLVPALPTGPTGHPSHTRDRRDCLQRLQNKEGLEAQVPGRSMETGHHQSNLQVSPDLLPQADNARPPWYFPRQRHVSRNGPRCLEGNRYHWP